MNKTLILSITHEDEISLKLPTDLEHLTELQSAFYLFAHKFLEEDDRVFALAEELIEEYNNQMEGFGGTIN